MKTFQASAAYTKAMKEILRLMNKGEGNLNEQEDSKLSLLILAAQAYEKDRYIIPALPTIKTNDQYENALLRVSALMQKNNKPGSKSSGELQLLSFMIKEYELEHFPVPKPAL